MKPVLRATWERCLLALLAAGVAGTPLAAELPPRTPPALRLEPAAAQPARIDLAETYAGLKAIRRVGPALAWLPPAAELALLPASGAEATTTVLAARPAPGGNAGGGDFGLLRAELLFDDATTRSAVLALHGPRWPAVEFRFKPRRPGPRDVQLVGSFNAWQPGATPMHGPELDGTYRTRLPLPPGEHAYAFLVDGELTADDANPAPQGEAHSVRHVAASAVGAAGGLRLWPVPDLGGTSTDTARLRVEGGRVRRAVVLAGDQLVGAAGGPAESLRPGPHTLALELGGDTLTLRGLSAADGLARDGLLRVSAQLEGGVWAHGVVVRRPPLEGGVAYRLVTDRFADGDPGNNRRAAQPEAARGLDWHGGDWAGIRAQIEAGYFEQLRVALLVISPPEQQPDKAEPSAALGGRLAAAFRATWPVSFDEPELRFGSAEQLKGLVSAAHRRGLRVLLELNANQIHWDHLWRRRWPEYINKQFDPDLNANVRRFAETPQTTWEEAFLPDIDYGQEPSAVDRRIEAALGWLRRSGADGFWHERSGRVAPEFWSALARALTAEEARLGRPLLLAGDGAAARDLAVSLELVRPLAAAAARGNGLAPLAPALRAAPFMEDGTVGGGWAMPAISSLELPRASGFARSSARQAPGSKADDAQDSAAAAFQQSALALLYSLPGVPLLVQGDELALPAGEPGEIPPMVFKQLGAARRSTLDAARQAAELRRAYPELAGGILQPITVQGEGVAFARISAGAAGTPDRATLVVCNARPGAWVALELPANLGACRGLEWLAGEGELEPVHPGRPIRVRPNGPIALLEMH